jgi:hypothetical protein
MKSILALSMTLGKLCSCALVTENRSYLSSRREITEAGVGVRAQFFSSLLSAY